MVVSRSGQVLGEDLKSNYIHACIPIVPMTVAVVDGLPEITHN